MFSSNASRSITSSAVCRTIAGMRLEPGRCVARHRRSPMTSSYVSAAELADDDRLQEPELRMESYSSSIASSSNTWRGCFGVRS